MTTELLIKEAINGTAGYTEGEVRSVCRRLGIMLRDVVTVVRDYEDWFLDSPEDSWRLQRDMMKALDILPEPEDIWEQGGDGEFVVNDIPPEEFQPADLDDEIEMRR